MKEKYQTIALFLLEKKFLLTALEFYAELVEIGEDCDILEDFFQESNNFCEEELTRKYPPQKSGEIEEEKTAEKKLEEKISLLEFELRESKGENEILKNQLAKKYFPVSCQEKTEPAQFSEPVKEYEKF
eukprot:Sdes_comp24001_c0_seq1m22090